MRFALCLLLAASLHAEAQMAEERWRFALDGREWKLVPQDVDAPAGEQTYVRPGENAYFWTERVVSGFQRGAENPEEYVKPFVENLLDRCRPLKVSPLAQIPSSVIFQWEGDCRIVGPQFEYRRVDQAANGIHYLAYSAKPKQLTPEKKEAWLAIIRQASLKPARQ